jgi:DMSO/TMAO reductase YedYZ molybdopterin-dependent catalytic subunit
MEPHAVSRRTLLKGGTATLAGISALRMAGPAEAFPGGHDEVIPWLDQPAPAPPDLPNLLVWEELDSWITPADDFFVVSHYPEPTLDPQAFRLAVSGLVARPESFDLAALQARPRRRVDFTLECSGNTGLPFFIGGIGNARWGGTPLAPVLRQAGLLGDATEVIFWGADSGPTTIRDNPGVLPLPAGSTGTTEPDASGGLDLTITERFARSMSVEDALGEDNLLCYEMNGEPLPREHGFPLRLIAPGWYGIANVKWLTRIEVVDQRFAGRFMAREYVTIREQQVGGETVWTFLTVGRARLKSAPAKVTRRGNRYAVMGAAWGGEVDRVEVQVDDGPWQEARLREGRHGRRHGEFAWVFWTLRLGRLAPGEHTIRSRAIDEEGNVQPAPDDPFLASKRTYWESNGQITRRVLIPAAS